MMTNAKAEQDQRQNEESLRLLVDSVRDYAIFLLDTTGHVKTWNLGAQRTKGYLAQEIIGKHFSVFYLPEDVGKCAVELDGAMRDGRFEDEGWRVRKDGTRFWANVIITALRDASGKLIGFGKVTRDLSERARAEAERVQLARMQEAEKRNQELLAILGHELRNPLAPIVTALGLVRLRGGQATQKELAIIDRQVAHVNRLVDDLLDSSRSIQGKMLLARRMVEVGEALQSAIEMSRPMIEGRGQRLTVTMSSDELTVYADVQRMAQVFANLLNNASKFTQPGGNIVVDARSEGREVQVTVTDDGQGIAPSLMPRIFEFFSQGEQSLDRSLGGLGVGLGLASLLVKQHGGKLLAHSDGPGKGSEFTVRLPLMASPVDVAVQKSELLPASGVSRRVLIVDDNIDASEMLQSYLQERGHEAAIALDGPSALTTLDDFDAEVLLVDIGMPGMSGYDLAKLVRQRPRGQNVRIIGLSGYARDFHLEQQVPNGFAAHLHKPVDLRQLEAFISA
jgi:PAS domain S-box-containing protein